MPKAIDFFQRALHAFQHSNDAFRILSTLPHGDSHPAQKLIVLDSSFNPPTVAHAEMAVSAVAASPPNTRLMLLLAVNNADKAPKPASFPMRLGMMDGFARGLRERVAVPVDIGVTTLPYFHSKAAAIKTACAATNMEFLVGFDTVVRIFDPKYYPDGMQRALDPFFAAATLRVTMRPDDEWGTTADQEAHFAGLKTGGLDAVGGRAGWADRVALVQGVGRVVSSSLVREALAKGEDVHELVGDGVAEWLADAYRSTG